MGYAAKSASAASSTATPSAKHPGYPPGLVPGEASLWHFTKVSPCPRFLQGASCSLGAACPMAHSLGEIAKARRPFRHAIFGKDAASDSSSSSSSGSSYSERSAAPPQKAPASMRVPGRGVWEGTDVARSRSREQHRDAKHH